MRTGALHAKLPLALITMIHLRLALAVPLLPPRAFPSPLTPSTSTSEASAQGGASQDEGMVRKGIRAAQKYWLLIFGICGLLLPASRAAFRLMRM